ncbi:WD40 repeat domain-containing protein [Nordella sp. HKS 07]|uniref:WD40 repeat domain-containing protein n=1 Tax=Nordella sp. HKS 07 TaxID=2712222 RepID=UPI00352D72DA
MASCWPLPVEFRQFKGRGADRGGADGHELVRVSHDGAVNALVFSPHSKLLATASRDKTARIVAGRMAMSSPTTIGSGQ